jgi:hypothetical protein
VVRAWEKYFKGIANVRISHGDILERPADAIVSPANSFGYMDGGIDLVYLRRFGWELQTRLQAHLRDEHDGELPVGQATIVETFDTAIPYLVSAQTMRIPMNVSSTINAYLAFRAASELSSCITAKCLEPLFAQSCALDYVRRSAECHPICLHGRWPQPLRLVCLISSWDPAVIATCWGLDGREHPSSAVGRWRLVYAALRNIAMCQQEPSRAIF